ncbi:hypothetical protein [Vibrio jasicida]|uniref:hypothetical protein n=1 Tax=Vibrio jasicida TaxID=766224 RepID=UPI0012690C76|nr:hypothetical protein [Vibrio jasicida]
MSNPRCSPVAISDELTLRTLHISNKYNKKEQLTVLIFDTTGIGDSIDKEIRRKIRELTNSIDTDRVIIASTHTHSGLDYQGIWGE